MFSFSYAKCRGKHSRHRMMAAAISISALSDIDGVQAMS